VLNRLCMVGSLFFLKLSLVYRSLRPRPHCFVFWDQDQTYSLIVRMRHNVIKTGLKKINLVSGTCVDMLELQCLLAFNLKALVSKQIPQCNCM
jgi:hypothetical protein